MYEELIQKLNPKPEFNLKWYNEKDVYSEGDIEDVMIHLIAEHTPEEYEHVILEHFSWSTYYHLTHIRKNILNWYPFEKEASVLEIGCGLGAITGMLCDKVKKVTAVELSQKRATAALLRCRDKENLKIIVGNLNDIEFEEKFDYITLIGVLEYQGSYTNSDNPYMDFLKKIKKLLKPDGKLLIAIENQYGLKYWCGAREDHTSIPFDGMNQYKLSDRKVRTFSRNELERLVKSCGYRNTFFYYPLPDYKLPTVIYSEKQLPINGCLQNMIPYYAPDKSTVIAMEKDLYKDVVDHGAFEFMANSFLVECTDSDDFGKVTFASLSSERAREYRIGTRFTKEGFVEKFALNEETEKSHLSQIRKNEQLLLNHNLHLIESRCEDGLLKTAYCTAPLLENIVLEAFERKDEETVFSILDKVYQDVLLSSEEVPYEENVIYTLGLGIQPNEKQFGKILKIGYLDLILRNAFLKDDTIYWFDQEWILENVPAKYMMYRLLKEFYNSYPFANDLIPLQKVAAQYDLVGVWREFGEMETLFAGVVMDKEHFAESNAFRDISLEKCIDSINRLLAR